MPGRRTTGRPVGGLTRDGSAGFIDASPVPVCWPSGVVKHAADAGGDVTHPATSGDNSAVEETHRGRAQAPPARAGPISLAMDDSRSLDRV